MNKFRKLGLISYNGKIEVHRSLFRRDWNLPPTLRRTILRSTTQGLGP